jgi:Fe-S cluster assembly ATP-binding protein
MLQLENISFKVPFGSGEKEIIRDVSLSLPPDRLVVVTGPNGGGKSTLARLIAGIERPTTGSILLDGEDITDKSVAERAQLGIGFAFQQPVRFKGIRVIDLLRLAARKQLTTSEACHYLSAVGLCAQDYVRREVNASLSGGELKRIEIATVFAKASKISIFDEPEAGIDLWSFQNLIQVFREMRRAIRGTILIISHQERILEIADDILVLKDGSIVKRGPKVSVLPTLIGTEFAVGSCPQNGPGCFEGLSVSRLATIPHSAATAGGPPQIAATGGPGAVPADSSANNAGGAQ